MKSIDRYRCSMTTRMVDGERTMKLVKFKSRDIFVDFTRHKDGGWVQWKDVRYMKELMAADHLQELKDLMEYIDHASAAFEAGSTTLVSKKDDHRMLKNIDRIKKANGIG